MARIIKVAPSVVRQRGRPRQDTVRIETMVPRKVYNQLVAVERETRIYRTRVACAVLCEWASATVRGVGTSTLR
jgi:hypothetical protein